VKASFLVVLVDVCRAVGIENNRKVAARLKVDEKDAIGLADSMGRLQQTTIVNRPGLTKVLRYSTACVRVRGRLKIEPTDSRTQILLAKGTRGQKLPAGPGGAATGLVTRRPGSARRALEEIEPLHVTAMSRGAEPTSGDDEDNEEFWLVPQNLG
jgi:hypothetical protein